MKTAILFTLLPLVLLAVLIGTPNQTAAATQVTTTFVVG